MKISPLVVLLIGLAIGGAIFGSCQASRATEAELRLNDALAQHRGSLDAWQDERQALTVSLGALRRDSAALAVSYRTARGRSLVAHDSILALLKALPDSQRRMLEPAIVALGVETASCDAFLRNCEQRVQNAEARARGDSLQLLETGKLLLTTEGQWRLELQRNRPGFLGLRTYWKARRYTIPLTALSAFLLLRR